MDKIMYYKKFFFMPIYSDKSYVMYVFFFFFCGSLNIKYRQ